ncbi:hypothetical protein ACLOJK_022479 [Asimina triloba]
MDPQRVYPVDGDAHKPPYEMLSKDGPPSTHRRSVPRYPSKTKRSAFSCCCCLGCCSCFCFTLLCMVITFFYALYTAYTPELPSYKVQSLQVTAFNLLPDFTLHAEFLLAVQAKNPNPLISIIYGKSSSVSVVYKGSELCSGSLPAFRQGEKNMTVMEVKLKGDSPFGSGLQEALMDNRESKKIPLVVFVQVPVIVVLERSGVELGPLMVRVVCHLVVDNLSPNEKINILKTEYNVDL